jgi:hypothetical protein
MNASPTPAARTASPPRPRFVLVNERVPRTGAECALCCAKIERTYVRELQTRLVYCDATCFSGRGKTAMSALWSRARRVS